MTNEEKVTQFFNRNRDNKTVDDKTETETGSQATKEQEEDMDAYIDNYNKNTKIEDMGLSAEAEEEETFKMTFNEDGKIEVTQTEEKKYFKNGDAAWREVDTSSIHKAKSIDYVVNPENSVDASEIIEVVKDARREYQNIMVDTLVMRIINDIKREMGESVEAAAGILGSASASVVTESIEKAMEKEYLQKKMDLQKAVRSGKVHYEDIPDYIEQEVKERLEKTMREIASII